MPPRPALSLVRASLDLGRVLVDRDGVVLRARGTCMYPTIRNGDFLRVRSRKAEDVRVGDIAVCRRPAYMFGHRVIGTGIEAGRAFILTRPDTSNGESDGPTFDDNLLGVVVEARRAGKIVSLEPRSYPRLARWAYAARLAPSHAAFLIRRRLIQALFLAQRTAVYRRLGKLWLARARSRMSFAVLVPFLATLGDSVFQEFPVDVFDPRTPLRDKLVVRWTLVMKLRGARHPVARMTFAIDEEGQWKTEDSHIRMRYRGIGLEMELNTEASRILAEHDIRLFKGGFGIDTSIIPDQDLRG
jgi:hypothetical protein